MDQLLQKNIRIVNIKNIVFIMILSIILCTKEAYIVIDNIIYRLSKTDNLFQILSNREFILVAVPIFIILIYYSLFYTNNNYVELIRFGRRDKYYIDKLKQSYKFVLVFFCIIFLNIFLSIQIKGSNEIGFSKKIIDILSENTYRYENLVFMNRDIINYNPVFISILYIFILILFYMNISNILSIIDAVTQNKIIIILVAFSIYIFILFNINFGNENNIIGYLLTNHISINSNGFMIFSNRYLNLTSSVIYLGVINICITYLGIKISKTKEVFDYKKV